MLKLQEKLFFKSNVRKIILLILILGGLIYHIWIFARTGVIKDIVTYGYTDFWMYQVYSFIYYFILIIFLAYDYFREVPNAELLDIIKISDGYARSDFVQAFVMLQLILFSALIFLIFFIFGFYIADTLTVELFFYLCRLVFLYIILNGIVAVLLAWLLSRTVGKLLGYIFIIIFTCLVSPIATSEISYLSMLYRNIYDLYKVFIINPEGLYSWFPGSLLPVNLSITARTLFWILIFSLGLLLYSKIKHKKWIIPALATLIVLNFTYLHLPTSFYSGNESYGESDSYFYDQMVYIIDKTVTGKEEDGFVVTNYEMTLNMGRIMDASVSIYPADKNLPEYKMTLYHLYNIESVTDENGISLPYERDGDYLVVYNQSDTLKSICVNYKGGLANFYANSKMINLPGWFAYYPIPGYRLIYQDYTYIDNQLEEAVSFDIYVNAYSTVYSDLEQVEKNHFVGDSYGVTLVSGFMRETVLENGIHCIYPYLYKLCDPTSDMAKDDADYVLDHLANIWTDTEKKTVILLPTSSDGEPNSLQQGSLVVNYWWTSLAKNLRERGDVLGKGDVLEPDIEKITASFLDSYMWYRECGDDFLEFLTYSSLKEMWDELLAWQSLDASTDEEFEEFILELLGQEELDRIMETKQDEE